MAKFHLDQNYHVRNTILHDIAYFDRCSVIKNQLFFFEIRFFELK